MFPDQQCPITTDQIIGLHAKAMKTRGQVQFPIDKRVRDCVDEKVGNANTADQISVVDKDFAQPGLSFAGYALFYLVKGHCFVDGNKRIGWIVAVEVLRAKGLEINSTDEEAIDFVRMIARGEVSNGASVVNWIARRIVSIQSGQGSPDLPSNPSSR